LNSALREGNTASVTVTEARLSDLTALIRAPAALSIPGDTLVGMTATGQPIPPRALGMMASSVCIYWAGMALNDYADATIDAVERPQRPIPSGRVSRRTAFVVATTLTGAGLVLAGLSGGRRGLVVSTALAALVWAYDLKLKSTPAGAVAMAGTRTLDVLAGAATVGSARAGLGSALVVGAHTYTLMMLSRHEVSGAPAWVPASTLAGTAGIALAAALPVTPRSSRVGTALSAAVYLGAYGGAQATAVRAPNDSNIRNAVAAGILGTMPLQATLVARTGAGLTALALAILHRLARRLSGRVSAT
jgi:hypothetical protein